MLLSYHLCLVAFIVTFVPDNGLLDFPTNFLLFFVLFAIQSLTVPLKRPPSDLRASQNPGTPEDAPERPRHPVFARHFCEERTAHG